MTDLHELRERLCDRVEELAAYLFPNGKRERDHWCVGDITGAPGRSFKICLAGEKAGLWGDFAEPGKHSRSLLELWMQVRNVDFTTALREAALWLGEPALRSPMRRSHVPPRITAGTSQEFLSDDNARRAVRMAEALRDAPDLCERLARSRGWRPGTIRSLALEPSLGWHEGKLAFLYETGVKLRWRKNGDRIIRWAFGKPWLWRGCYLGQAKKVTLVEGETDAISLMDSGIENDGETLVVALPSASTFDASWGELFSRKDVVLAFDADAAGEEATRRVSAILLVRARTVSRVDWEALRHAS